MPGINWGVKTNSKNEPISCTTTYRTRKSNSPKNHAITLWWLRSWPSKCTTPMFNFISDFNVVVLLGTRWTDGCPWSCRNSLVISSAHTWKRERYRASEGMHKLRIPALKNPWNGVEVSMVSRRKNQLPRIHRTRTQSYSTEHNVWKPLQLTNHWWNNCPQANHLWSPNQLLVEKLAE
jgi:hypothetical protein